MCESEMINKLLNVSPHCFISSSNCATFKSEMYAYNLYTMCACVSARGRTRVVMIVCILEVFTNAFLYDHVAGVGRISAVLAGRRSSVWGRAATTSVPLFTRPVTLLDSGTNRYIVFLREWRLSRRPATRI